MNYKKILDSLKRVKDSAKEIKEIESTDLPDSSLDKWEELTDEYIEEMYSEEELEEYNGDYSELSLQLLDDGEIGFGYLMSDEEISLEDIKELDFNAKDFKTLQGKDGKFYTTYIAYL